MLKRAPAALLLTFLAASASAQGTAISPGQSPGATPPTTAPAPKAERAARSKDCSAQADRQGLHGKARKRFRSKCKAGEA